MSYVPARGDVAWMNFDPQTGHEQAGHRPALIMSPKAFNLQMGMAIVCPITSRARRHRFEITIPGDFVVKGVVLSHQVKSLDWRARNTEFIARAPTMVVDEALKTIRSILR